MEESLMLVGWIKVWRKLASDSLWLEERFTKGQAWVDLLLLAQGLDKTEYYDGQYKNFTAGIVYKSISWLARRWGWNRKTAAHFLTQLETANMIQVTSQPRLGSVIRIVNWQDYQSGQFSSQITRSWENAKNAENADMGNAKKPEKCGQMKFETAQGFECDFRGGTTRMTGQMAGQMTGQMTGHKKEDKEYREEEEYIPPSLETVAPPPHAPLGEGMDGGSSKNRIPAEWRDQFDSYEAYVAWRNQ